MTGKFKGVHVFPSENGFHVQEKTFRGDRDVGYGDWVAKTPAEVAEIVRALASGERPTSLLDGGS